MLKKHSQFFESVLFLFDLSMILGAWLAEREAELDRKSVV